MKLSIGQFNAKWRDYLSPNPRKDNNFENQHKSVVMQASSAGKTDNIVTGRPPKIKMEYQKLWMDRIQTAEIERMFK